MKKILVFLLLLFIVCLCQAQRDPQWLMPLYFTDANGDRDTVYFGYDPEASTFGNDEFLGEEWIEIDTSQFNIYLFSYPDCHGADCQPIHTTTIKKTDVRNIFIGTSIGFCKGKLPIVMKWVDSLLYASSCPYPDLSPRPRARIDLTCEDYEPGIYYSCNPIDGPPLSLTDYPAPEIYSEVMDSMVFDGSGMYPPASVFYHTELWLKAHDHTYGTGLEESGNPGINLFPNPVTGQLTIQLSQPEPVQVSIISITGQVLLQGNSTGNEITFDLSDLNEGIYLVLIATKTFNYYNKIVIPE